ncbi:hypothetical protein GGR56DRAFT_568128 [Xylariaceae sp. FL0804]|nr:hypothetical protein GGR56DRAFT_568128 [Xylariaceae sp. FL0804]
MKLYGFLLSALAGFATAAATEPQHAEAYILKQTTTARNNDDASPSIPASLAQAILLQRLSAPGRSYALGPLPESLTDDEAVSYINQFGKASRPLFQAVDASEPQQLVIAISGLTSKKRDGLDAFRNNVPLAFTAPGLRQLPAQKTSRCSFQQAIVPGNSKCWDGKPQYLHYDMAKDGKVISQLVSSLETLRRLATDGSMETTVVFLDPSAPAVVEADELRRRESGFQEKVMSEQEAEEPFVDMATADAGSSSPAHAFAASARPTVIPGCFTSQNACTTATDACSGHGECVDKWRDSAGSCFFCRCEQTKEYDAREGRTHVYHWGGAACQKRDVSTPFWLFAGVTIALAATVAFSISLLFGIGEEKLPGVIGAGVSRSK